MEGVCFDVNCVLDDGTQIDLEMQASRIQEDTDGSYLNLKGKSIYNLCDLHSSRSAKGLRRCDKLAHSYQVTFCSYTVFPNRPEFVNSFSLRHDVDNELLSDAIRIIYVELSKLQEIMKKSVADMTDLEKWAVFFPVRQRTAGERNGQRSDCVKGGVANGGRPFDEHQQGRPRARGVPQPQDVPDGSGV